MNILAKVIGAAIALIVTSAIIATLAKTSTDEADAEVAKTIHDATHEN